MMVEEAKEAAVIASSELNVERDFPVPRSVTGQVPSLSAINMSSLESIAERSVEAATEMEVRAKSESWAELDVIARAEMKAEAEYKASAFVRPENDWRALEAACERSVESAAELDVERKCEMMVEEAKEAAVIASSELNVERDFPVPRSVTGQVPSLSAINMSSLESIAEMSVESPPVKEYFLNADFVTDNAIFTPEIEHSKSTKASDDIHRITNRDISPNVATSTASNVLSVDTDSPICKPTVEKYFKPFSAFSLYESTLKVSFVEEPVEVTTETSSNFFTKPSMSSIDTSVQSSPSDPFSTYLATSHDVTSPTGLECYLDSIEIKNSMSCSGSGIKSYVDELESALPISFSSFKLMRSNMQVSKESNENDQMGPVDSCEVIRTKTHSNSNLLVSSTSKIATTFARFSKHSNNKLFGVRSKDTTLSGSASTSSLTMSRSPVQSDDDFSSYSEGPDKNTKSKTQRIMEKSPQEGQTGGAGGVSTWESFLKAEENWRKLRESGHNDSSEPFLFVTTDSIQGNNNGWEKLRNQLDKTALTHKESSAALDYDVVVCGGTLGIFIAHALQLRGFKVCVVEGGKLQGREQEWNISMDELEELVDLGILIKSDLDESITTEFTLCRSGFKNKEARTIGGYFDNGIGFECDTPGVLNLGVAPKILLEKVKQRFLKEGGVIKEYTPIKGIFVSSSLGVALNLGDKVNPITSRLVLDCMGNNSPISRQQRHGRKPDGVCCVVGSCAGGYDRESNLKGDIIYTNNEIQDKGKEGMLQYFWEAFPVNIGRMGNEPGTSDVKTTYMFTYLDADKSRPKLLTLMEDYWNLLPIYQPSIKDPETDLDVKRVLFAFFPTYRDSPLKPGWDRILAVGDASGIQSPLSFGGLGALTRHLGRITTAVSEALHNDCLQKDDLAAINPYTPNLSAAWMFQKAMSVRPGQKVDTKFVNRLLATNFKVMDDMGIDTIKPFLQDVIRIDGLVASLAGSFKADPLFMPQIVNHVGIPTLVEWLGHVFNMGVYTACDAVVSPVIRPFVNNMEDKKLRFRIQRLMEAWKFGSGSDYVLPRDDNKK